MPAIEMRLTGRQTSASGIARALRSLLDSGPFTRVELRLSSQTQPRLKEDDLRKQLMLLLRDHGHVGVAVSVRPHTGVIDDASGEHLLRVVPDERRAATVPQSAWRRWLPSWLVRAIDSGGGIPKPRQEPGLHPQVSTLAAQPPDPKAVTEAAKRLRQAVVKAVNFVESPIGIDLVCRPEAAQAVGRAHITVRVDSLHRVLEPLVTQGSDAIAQMVKSGGLALTHAFRVEYAFDPPRTGEGTSYTHESDIEVRLFLASTAEEVTVPPVQPAAALRTLRPEIPGLTSDRTQPLQTALPAEPPPTVPALTVRVLGTMAGPFEQPFELRFETLPARLDRQALQQAGFGRDHAELLVVASNSCPLSFSQGKAGQVLLHAATWADTMGTQMPMYFDQRSLAGLYGDRPLKAGGEVLVVNAPAGVRDPASGRLLPALVVELLPASARPGAAAAPWQDHQRAD